MKFARTLIVLIAVVLAGPIVGAVPVPAAEVIPTAQDMVIELNQGQLVRIDRAASAVFVANPAIAEVAVKSPHLIFVFAKKPGVTTLYAVDQNENVVANLRLVVTHDLAELQEILRSMIPQTGITGVTVDGSKGN